MAGTAAISGSGSEKQKMEDIVASTRSACYMLSLIMTLDPKLEQGRMPQSVLFTTVVPAQAAPSPQRYPTAMKPEDPSGPDPHHCIERSMGPPATIHDFQEVR